MATTVESRARQEQSALELLRLRDDVGRWLSHRRKHDERGQYKSQLAAIESLLTGAITSVDAALAVVDQGRSTPDVYEECRVFDLRVLWLRRVWHFFRDKFDQRDHPEIGPVLRAADEVVWSCHQQIVVHAKQRIPDQRLGPTPLPYIEPHYSPEAFPTELVPQSLKYEVDVGFLRDHLNQLPIPVVRLPPVCARSPWWLVYAGHEVGHHIQYSLLSHMGLVGLFRDRIGQVVSEHGGTDKDVQRWERWSAEIFADVFSVLAMGPWAVWAMVDLEMQKADTMFARRIDYPSPVVRLGLLAEIATRLELNGRRALRGMVPEPPTGDLCIREDSKMIHPVVDAALDTLPQVGVTLAELVAFRPEEYRPGGPVDRWATDLLGGERRPPARNLRSARLVAAASMAAWARLLDEDDDVTRPSKRAALAERSVQVIVANAEQDTREAGHADGTAPAGLGADLARALLAAPRHQLEG